MLELVLLFAAGFFFGYLVRALRSRRRRYRRLHLPPQGVRLDPMKKAEIGPPRWAASILMGDGLTKNNGPGGLDRDRFTRGPGLGGPNASNLE